MFKKFALNILNEVAESCESMMNSADVSDTTAEIYNKVSKDLTDAILVLSGKYCSDNFKYHLDNNLTLDKVVFRPGTKAFLDMFNEARDLSDRGLYKPNDFERFFLDTDIGKTAEFDGVLVPLDLPMMDYDEEDEDSNNAEYQGKDVELNKPKRGGSKKFYVYVKDGDKVKKVSFGSPDMELKVSDPEARKSFKARHKCETKNDKTTAGYWSCRIGRYPNLTGAKQKYTWW